ncbi:protein tipE [Coccinella septempunctata]|uniref:protein tipE n=1 Tax=Coccinella septempunctata TaxID=41139 RepID=UPI001D07C10D|nr:protein tipE [Coccinella septempunctata]
MEEKQEEQTCKQKLLFYTTAFFVLLGIFSLFSFLFLVPFVIDPAFTTIFMEFDETPVLCVTVKSERRLGVSNCSWTSCREGCTRDMYDCTQILVNYKKNATEIDNTTVISEAPSKDLVDIALFDDFDDKTNYSSLWFYKEARLLPNVKGCGYPPMLNCTIFLKKHKNIGTNFTCYYSRVDPSIVITDLDMWQVYMNLVYAMAIPIPSFIISVIYLAFAYFKIYNDDEEKAPLEKNAEDMDVQGDNGSITPVLQSASDGITPASEAFREDLASFGHHFKVAMVDEMSRDSFADGIVNSISISGNLGKPMTTSISSTGGPIDDI